MVTSNHIHLMVKDTGEHIISQSMQLIAGHTAQDYNQRKERKGAFWEDRYLGYRGPSRRTSTARCLVYIDLDMEYVDKVKAELGNKALHRQVAELDGTYALQEPSRPYAHGFAGKNDALRPDNTLPWNESAEKSQT